MKVAISGSRTFTDQDLVERVIDRLIERGDEVLIGDARSGVDYFAHVYLDYRADDVKNYEVYEAEWDKYGKSAGYLRNKWMIHDADQLIAMLAPGLPTKGTSGAIEIALKKGIPVYVYHEGAWDLRDNSSAAAEDWLARAEHMNQKKRSPERWRDGLNDPRVVTPESLAAVQKVLDDSDGEWFHANAFRERMNEIKGGEPYARELRALRKEGYVVESRERRFPLPSGWEYRLISRIESLPLAPDFPRLGREADLPPSTGVAPAPPAGVAEAEPVRGPSSRDPARWRRNAPAWLLALVDGEGPGQA
jgi:hypothetical protein